MKLIIGKRKTKKLIFKILFLCLIIYIIAFIFKQYVRLKEKRASIKNLQNQISEQQSKNEKIIDEINSINDQKNSKNSQLTSTSKVFYNIPGN